MNNDPNIHDTDLYTKRLVVFRKSVPMILVCGNCSECCTLVVAMPILASSNKNNKYITITYYMYDGPAQNLQFILTKQMFTML